MKYLLMILMLGVVSCGKQPGDECDNGGIVGTDKSCMTCPKGSPSTVGGSGCSAVVNGVACCSGVSTTTTSSTPYCSTGFCYSYLEQICCAKSSPYACKGGCYTYSGGGGCSSYRTQCY